MNSCVKVYQYKSISAIKQSVIYQQQNCRIKNEQIKLMLSTFMLCRPAFLGVLVWR